MKAYNLAFALFILSAIIGMINGMGIFNVKIAEIGLQADQATITEIKENIESQTDIDYSVAVKILPQMFHIFFSALITAITIIPMFVQYGIPWEIIAMIQAAIWIIYAWGIVQFVLDRSEKAIG